MIRTHTEFLSFAKLANTHGAIPVVTVALVCNDIAITNSSMSRYKKMKGSGALAHIGRGGCNYFARMSSGHLYEGINAIGAIRSDNLLSSIVSKCPSDAQKAFIALCECLPGGSENKHFKKYVGWIRNRIAFHYDANDLSWAIGDRAKRDSADTASLTAGEDIHTTRFEFADDILDSIVCRKLWLIPRSANLREQADRIGDWCDTKCREFLHFGGYFVPRFLQEHLVVS